MKKQKVGTRIGRYALSIVGLALAAVAAGEKGRLTTSIALASEEGMAVTSLFPSASDRVSPFLAKPAMDALLVKSSMAALSTDCAANFETQNNSYTEWWIYTMPVWGCISGLISTTVDWYWYLYESDGQTPLASCFAYDVVAYPHWPYGGGCSVNYYDYFDYDCVGDEQFHVYYRLYGQNWVGPLINDDGPTFGCAY